MDTETTTLSIEPLAQKKQRTPQTRPSRPREFSFQIYKGDSKLPSAKKQKKANVKGKGKASKWLS